MSVGSRLGISFHFMLTKSGLRDPNLLSLPFPKPAQRNKSGNVDCGRTFSVKRPWNNRSVTIKILLAVMSGNTRTIKHCGTIKIVWLILLKTKTNNRYKQSTELLYNFIERFTTWWLSNLWIVGAWLQHDFRDRISLAYLEQEHGIKLRDHSDRLCLVWRLNQQEFLPFKQ